MFRAALRIIALVVGTVAALVIGFLVWVFFALQPSRDVVSTVASPDGRFVAKLVEVNGGATTSFGYSVMLVESGSTSKGQEVASLYGAVRNKSAYGANLRWASPRELAVEYLHAKSSEVLNAKPKVAGVELAVTLRPNITDPTAPSGGMLYNLNPGR